MKRFIVSVLLLTFSVILHAEMIYLKDGQVIQGKILSESGNDITVQTQYQTKKILRNEIIRIMYGERKMEKIFMLMNDGTTQTGFLVDQDATQVIVRDTENSPKERMIPKSTIKQMSVTGEIVPLDPSINLRSGIMHHFNSKGSNLKPAPCFFAGSDFNFQYIKNIRMIAEGGFARNKSTEKDVYMQFIPIQAGLLYDKPSGNLHIIPKLTVGMSVIDFNDGEGGQERSFAFSSYAGLGCVYELSARRFYAGLWAEYLFMKDKSSMFHSMTATGSLSFRF